MLKLKKLFRFIFADDEDFSLENRLFLSAIIVGTLTSIFGAFLNLMFVTSLISSIIPLILTVLMFFLYYLVRFKRIVEPFKIPMIVVALIGISVIWIFNGGINGSNVMPGFVILILGLIIFPDKTKKYVILLFLTLNIIVYLIQFYRPDLIVNYASETDRWFDSLITLIYTSFFIFLIVIFIHKQYTLARFKSEESAKNYRELVENSPDAIVIYRDGQIIYCNKESLRLIGLTNTNQLVGKPVMQFVNPVQRELVITRMKKIQTEGAVLHMAEQQLLHHDGSFVDVEIKAMPISLENKPAVQLIIRDVTDRKLAEKKLLNERLLLRTIIDNIPDSMYSKDLEYRKTLANLTDVLYSGAKSETDLLGKDDFEFYPKDMAEKFRADDKVVIESGKPMINREGFILDGNGVKRWLLASKMPLRDRDNNIIGLVGISRDITERKLYEQAQKIILEISEIAYQQSSLNLFLQAVHQKVNTIVSSKNFYVALYDTNTDTYNFPYYQDEVDNSLPDVKYNIINGYTDFVRRTGKTQLITEATKSELLKTSQVNAYGAVPSIWLGVPIKTENQENAIGVIAIHDYIKTDAYTEVERATLEIIANSIGKFIERVKYIEELKNAKDKAEESELKARTYFDYAPDGICIVDRNGNYLDVNEEFTRLLGYSKDEILSERKIPLVVEADYPKAREVNEKLIKEGKYTEEFLFLKKDGSIFSGLMSSVKVSENQFLSFIKNINDIKKIEQELVNAKEKAEESDKLKSAFLANMSHEIRTPMNGILGFADLLKTPDLTGAEQLAYIQIIKKSGDRMLNIINDIVDISKIESGQTKVFISETKVNEQTEFLYSFFKPEVENKGIQFILHNGLPDLIATIKTDKEKLYAVLTNLIKNAIKFTNSGSIEFGYDLVAAQHTVPLLRFYVKDTGFGIPANRQKAIFDRFVQADIADSRAFQGAGLGLSISKAYIEMINGKIWVQSEEGRGSTFYFAIPYNAQDEQNLVIETKMENQESTQIKNLKILIVEDDVTSEMLISLSLRMISREVLKAKNGYDAIEMCRNNPDIDLIMMDVKMPKIDGYEATRQIRTFNKNVCIIAQTAYGLAEEREKALNAGCDDYMAKPLNITLLKGLIQKHLKKTGK